jgi:hypothetical protein
MSTMTFLGPASELCGAVGEADALSAGARRAIEPTIPMAALRIPLEETNDAFTNISCCG